jgi:Fe2+/Zn2+ uptake regulation proteins
MINRRNSIQRQLLSDALKILNHPTAAEIFAEIKKTYPHMSLGTVYRNLQLMAEKGTIRRICAPDSPERFDVNPEPHQHIKCVRCGRFLDVDEEILGDIDSAVERATNFYAVGHSVFFNGICPECRGKGEK